MRTKFDLFVNQLSSLGEWKKATKALIPSGLNFSNHACFPHESKAFREGPHKTGAALTSWDSNIHQWFFFFFVCLFPLSSSFSINFIISIKPSLSLKDQCLCRNQYRVEFAWWFQIVLNVHKKIMNITYMSLSLQYHIFSCY